MNYTNLLLHMCIIPMLLLVSTQAIPAGKNNTAKITITKFEGGCFNAHKGSRMIMWCA